MRTDLRSVPQAARQVDVAEKVIRTAIHDGTLRAQKVGASWVTTIGEVDKWWAAFKDTPAGIRAIRCRTKGVDHGC